MWTPTWIYDDMDDDVDMSLSPFSPTTSNITTTSHLQTTNNPLSLYFLFLQPPPQPPTSHHITTTTSPQSTPPTTAAISFKQNEAGHKLWLMWIVTPQPMTETSGHGTERNTLSRRNITTKLMDS
ncbi:hypothetical protein HanLR1_Chr17g0670491 [Helianthus annuus]|nr:hypothetical protein HanHA89_Chr17g0711921 [Helianthus annuus]KAJ0632907.1 hypothetical protein HanLR1_Chr17g0670491 [Helianthus annuus]